MKKTLADCTSLQKAYFFGRSKYSELHIGSQYYYEIDIKSLNLPNFIKALRMLSDRHEMLRAKLTDDGKQFVDNKFEFREPFLRDFKNLSAEELKENILNVRKIASGFEIDSPQRSAVEVHVSILPKNIFRIHFNHNLCIFDLGSVDVYTRELDLLYHDPSASLPEISYSFFEYIEDLEKKTKGFEGKAAEEFWKAQIADLPSGPEFPLLRKGPYNEKSQLRNYTRNIPGEIWEKILQVSKDLEVSPTIIFCYSFMRTLSLWSKSQKFSIAMLINDRPLLAEKAATLIGQLAKTVVLSCDFSSPKPALSHMVELKDQLRKVIKHSIFDGIKVAQEINRKGGSSGQVPIPVVFVSNLSHYERRKDDLKSNRTFSINQNTYVFNKLETPNVYFDFQTYTLSDGSVHISWDIFDKIFPEGMIAEMLDAFVKILHFVADKKMDELGDPENFFSAAHVKVLKNVQSTNEEESSDLLHELFALTAKEFPEKTALVSDGRRLSYRQLEIYSSNLAAHLRAKGVKPNELVALILPKSSEQVVAALGVIQSGAAYIPIQPQFPKLRIELLIRRGCSKFAVVSRNALPIADLEDVEFIYIEDFISDQLSKVDLASIQSANDLAYVIFTSGSTGEPKGVAIDHRGCINTILDINSRFNIQSDAVILAISALTFDLSVYDLFGILAVGGTIVIPSDIEAQSPQKWSELIVNEKVNLWNSAPAVMQMLITFLLSRPSQFQMNLRTAFLSGDWIQVDLPDQIRKASPGCKVISLGGATEASIWSIYYATADGEKHARSIPYGKPLANQNVYVLDDCYYPRAPFVPGRIYLAGVGLAKGYWKDEAKTAAQFISHPRTGERLYDTGDLGRYLPDGNIEFLGREDHQVKINGYRIELSEIEATIEKTSLVEKAIVMVSPRNPNVLVAFYKRDQAVKKDIKEDLADALSDNLPSYMIPKMLIEMKEWPHTTSGKIDRKALPLDRLFEDRTGENVAPPRISPTERAIQKVFCDVLKVNQFGVNDDFYHFGGDSLSAIDLLTQVEHLLQVTLPVSIISGVLTISKVGKEIDSVKTVSWTPVVKMSQKSAPNLNLVHPAGGNIACYQELTKHVEASVFGFQAQGFSNSHAALDTVEALAQSYAMALRLGQPHGPYLIGGWSFGGMVALEMSQILWNEFHESSSVLMIDFVPPSLKSPPSDDVLWLGLLRDLTRRGDENKLKELIFNGKESRSLAASRYLLNELNLRVSKENLENIYQVYKANICAYTMYQPKKYKAEVFKIQSKDTENYLKNFRAPWGHSAHWAKWLIECPKDLGSIPGDHYTIFHLDALKIMGERINKFLDMTKNSRIKKAS